LKLTAFDHADEPGGCLCILAVEHIPEIVQAAPPPLNLIDNIPHGKRAKKEETKSENLSGMFAVPCSLGQPAITRGS
jgi:hypothetical protein